MLQVTHTDRITSVMFRMHYATSCSQSLYSSIKCIVTMKLKRKNDSREGGGQSESEAVRERRE